MKCSKWLMGVENVGVDYFGAGWDNIRPSLGFKTQKTSRIALFFLSVSIVKDFTILCYTYRIMTVSSNCHNITPQRYIRLPIFIVSHRYHRSVLF